jgi:archaellum component FlaG (FlaF/FlaG flagellin family)
MLYYNNPNAWLLIDPNPPEIEVEIPDLAPTTSNYVEGEAQMDAHIIIQNTGNTGLKEVQYEGKLFDADGNEVATDSGVISTSGPSLAGPGEETSITTSFVTDGYTAGDYSLQVIITTTDENGDQVINEIYSESYFHVEETNPELGFTEILPGQESYIIEDYQVDGIFLIKNTGNVPLYSIDYSAELIDADGNVVATDTATLSSSSGPRLEVGAEDQITASFLPDELAVGDYTVRLSVTSTDGHGNQVTDERVLENLITVEGDNTETNDTNKGIPGFPTLAIALGLILSMFMLKKVLR